MAGNANSAVRFTAVGTTDVGRIREHNEDNFLAVDLGGDRKGTSGETLTGQVRPKGLSFVVADGMGGAAAGEVASQMAVDMLHGEFKNADFGNTVKAEQAVIGVLEAAIHKANEAIFRKGQDSKDHAGMGTTLTASVVLGDRSVDRSSVILRGAPAERIRRLMYDRNPLSSLRMRPVSCVMTGSGANSRAAGPARS